MAKREGVWLVETRWDDSDWRIDRGFASHKTRDSALIAIAAHKARVEGADLWGYRARFYIPAPAKSPKKRRGL